MARTDNLTNFLTDVAEAIRTKSGTSEKLSASEFDTAITNLPSGGGGSYEAIGTTVTIEAQGAIAKGSRWVGVASEDVTYTCNTQDTNLTQYWTKYSKDLSVACYRDVAKSATTYNIAFFNSQTLNYDTYSVDVSHITRNYTFTCQMITEDGTVAFLQTVNSGYENCIIAIEIDKENKTAVAYECQLVENSKPGGTGSAWCQDCAIMYNSGHIWKYKYNKETHELDLLEDYASNTSASQTPTYWARVDDKTFIGLYNTYIHKFIIEENTFSHTFKDLSSYTNASYFRISYDGQYISGRQYLYSLNTADLMLTLLSSDMGTGDTTSLPHSGGKLIVVTNLYDITNVSPENPTATLLYTHDSNMATSSLYGRNDFYSKCLDTSYRIRYFPTGENVQYSIRALSGNQIENGKYYGIATSTMSVGDKGTAQLLFSTRGGVKNE
jgi:hypothetical protein